MHNLRSTFPLDEGAISRTALRRVMTDPITWVPFVPVVAAYSIFNAPGMMVLPAGAVVLAGVGSYWWKQWAGLTEPLRRTMIQEHNRAQNALLRESAEELRAGGALAAAGELQQVLALKMQVEQRLHEDGTLTSQKSQLEQMVDALCFGVRDQLQGMAGGEQRQVPEKLAQVRAAVDTLQATAAQLDTILGPSEGATSLSDSSLEEVTRRLREEAEIAQRVQARLRAQTVVEPFSGPAPLQSE